MKMRWMLGLCLVPALSFGQDFRNRVERTQDRRELRQNTREARDDRRDKRELERLLSDFDFARHRRDFRSLAALDRQLESLVATELRESHVELAKDTREVRRGQREVVHARSHREWRDDRRDLRDDRRDAVKEHRALARVRAIQGELFRLRNRFDRRSLDKKRGLIVELLKLAHFEQRQNAKERREDRRELREDRRDARR